VAKGKRKEVRKEEGKKKTSYREIEEGKNAFSTLVVYLPSIKNSRQTYGSFLFKATGGNWVGMTVTFRISEFGISVHFCRVNLA
jgi:hypothetical protein